MITDALLNKIINEVDASLTHIGIGTGVEPSSSDTLLAGETIRKVADSYIDQHTIIKELYLDENEGNGIQFTNVGIFGEGATTQLGTGTLLSGGRMDMMKENKQSMTISVEITIGRV